MDSLYTLFLEKGWDLSWFTWGAVAVSTIVVLSLCICIYRLDLDTTKSDGDKVASPEGKADGQ